MPIRISGSTGVSGLDGTATDPSTQGANTSSGLFFPTINTVAIATNSSERLRIDSSGSLLIGAASAPGTGLLQVVRNANDGLTRSLVSNSNSGSDAISYMLFGNDTASGGAAGLRMGSSTSSSLVPGNGLSMFNNIGALTFSVSGTERMRITSGGSVGLGTSSPSYLLHVANGNMAITSSTGGGQFQITDDSDSGRGVLLKSNHSGTANTYIGTNSSVKNLIFGIDQIERMRLDTSGNLGINTSGNTSKVAIRKDDQSGYTTSTLELQNAVGNVLIGFHAIGSVSPMLRCERGFTGLDSVNGNQSAWAPFRASAFTVNSDYREKENIVPLQNALSRVTNLKPCRFNYIEGSMSYFDGRTVDGFIAHELHDVIPEAVVGEKDAISDEGKPLFQSVDLAKVVPLLTAAIQELKAEFDAYKASHP